MACFLGVALILYFISLRSLTTSSVVNIPAEFLCTRITNPNWILEMPSKLEEIMSNIAGLILALVVIIIFQLIQSAQKRPKSLIVQESQEEIV